MRIAVDARSFFMRTGIARYTRAILEALIGCGGQDEWLLLISDRHTVEEVPLARTGVQIQVSSAPWLGGSRERRQLEVETCAWNADVFYSIFPAVALETVPSVVTIFDLIPWSHSHLLPTRVVRAFRVASARAVPRARRIVAISDATATEVERRFPARARDIVIAPCGVSRELRVPHSSELSQGERQGVLFVGTIEPRKNVRLLVQAARELPHVPFTIVGKQGWGSYDLAADLANLSSVTWRPRVDDVELAALYARAAVFVYPSQVEGFGLPVLEALAHGALPLISTAPALREIVPDPDLTVDVDVPGALAQAIARWVTRPGARAERVAALRARATRFTWTEAARVIRDALHDPRAGASD